MEPAGFNHHGPDHSGPSSRVALPSARMSTKEVFKALERYTEESRESDPSDGNETGCQSNNVDGASVEWVDARARLLRIQSEADEYPAYRRTRRANPLLN